MKSNILIITGGTGGHVIPAVNFLNYINNESKNIFLLTDSRGYKFIRNSDKTKIIKIHSSHLSGNIFFKLRGIIKLLIGFFQSLIIYLKLRPKIIISFGSYASVGPLFCFVLFKYLFKTKLYIHEQNSIIGQTNKFFSKQSSKIFVNYDKDYEISNKYKNKIEVVGLPEKIETKIYKYNKSKDNKKINFLVFAGSQGSLNILIIFSKIIKELKKISILKNFNFFIQCPIKKQNEIRNLLTQNKCEFEIKSFFDNFDEILSQTNVALCRSGAGTINDLINFKIPAIISPLPSAKDNHQYENAKILSEIDCAIITDEDCIEVDKIILFIRKVIDDKNFQKSLIDKYSKIKKYNTSELMWTFIKNG